MDLGVRLSWLTAARAVSGLYLTIVKVSLAVAC
jgi:hypothetical protein